MKFLCVCQGGRVRSGAMAWALKDFGQDSLAAGWEATSAETLRMLCDWADGIIVMQREMVDLLADKVGRGMYRLETRKILVVDVGADVFGTPTHDALLPYLRGIVDQWRKQGFKLTSALGHPLPLEKP